MEIEHVCPKKGACVRSEIIGNGQMEKKERKFKNHGLPDEVPRSWKTIIVKCSFCGANHEYALILDP